jgi:hypothetical protein
VNDGLNYNELFSPDGFLLPAHERRAIQERQSLRAAGRVALEFRAFMEPSKRPRRMRTIY